LKATNNRQPPRRLCLSERRTRRRLANQAKMPRLQSRNSDSVSAAATCLRRQCVRLAFCLKASTSLGPGLVLKLAVNERSRVHENWNSFQLVRSYEVSSRGFLPIGRVAVFSTGLCACKPPCRSQHITALRSLF
jgi:hypothetical protein